MTQLEVLITLCLVVVAILTQNSNCFFFEKKEPGPPVVIIPGDAGSMLDAKLNKPTSNDGCATIRDWFRLWLNVKEMLPSNVVCGVNNRKMVFEPATNTSSNSAGVQTRISGFGTAHSVEYIDDSWTAYLLGNIGAYAHALVEELLDNGYERDVSVRGAPYDFRIAMSSHRTYFQNLRELVENTYEKNDNKKVVLISHSMGGIFATWFLNLQSQEWKDRYIDSFIALSTPWGGSTDTLQAVTSGYTFGISFISPLVVRPEQRTIETNYLMLPNARVWSANKHFVLSDERSYTASRTDMNDMFRRIGVSTERYNYVRDANEQSGASGVMPPNPGVLTYCIYGDGLDTSDVLDFRGGNFPDSKPRIQTISGDGTVSYESLSACREWNLGDREIKVQSASHSGVLQDDKGIQEILKILLHNK